MLFSQLVMSDSLDCNYPNFPVFHHLPEFAQILVHWVSDAIQSSHPLSSPFPPAISLSQHQGLFQWVVYIKYIQVYTLWPIFFMFCSALCNLSLFILFMGFSRQEYWSGLPFPSPVDQVLSELSTMTHPPWVALHGMAHSFIELERLCSMWSVWLVFCDCGFHSFCPLMEKDKRLMEASCWERLTVLETGSCSDGQRQAQ